MNNYLVIDFETKSFVNFDNGAWKYAEHESTDIICMSYKTSDMQKAQTWLPGEPIPSVLKDDGQIIIAHNVLFEYAIMVNVCIVKYGFPAWLRDYKRYRCTSAMARSVNLPGNLAGVGAALNLPMQKMDIGQVLINKYSKPAKSKGGLYFRFIEGDDLNAMVMYCERDVEVTEVIYKTLSVLDNIKIEEDIFMLDLKQNINGVPIDIETLHKVCYILDERKAKADKKAEQYGINVRSPKQLKEYFWNKGIYIENFQEKTVKDFLKDCDDKEIKEILNLRIFSSRSSTKKFDAIAGMVGKGDNRLRYSLFYYGAFTGRWAGRGFQPHNLPKGFIDEKELEIRIEKFTEGKVKFWETMNIAKSLIPGMLCAEKDHSLIVGDFAAIEARVVAFIAKEEKLIKMFQNDKDVYVAMAATVFKKTMDDVTKEDRKLGKQIILACGYGMGHNKFYQTCQSYGLAIPEDLAEKSVSLYRSTFKNIVNLWYGVDRAFRQAYQQKSKVKVNEYIEVERKNGYVSIKLPSGRRLYYHNIKIIDGEITYLNHQKKQRVKVYGGLLVENIVQAIARDLLVYCMLKMDTEGLTPILSVHDEIICHEDNKGLKKKEELFNSIMNSVPDWFGDFPIKTETEILRRYVK